jgi:repressor of nif and glnA expression
MKQRDKINLTKFMVNGFPIPPGYKDIINLIRKTPKMTSKNIAKALKKNKLYSELKLLNDFGFISVEGYPSKFEITSKGLKELGEK